MLAIALAVGLGLALARALRGPETPGSRPRRPSPTAEGLVPDDEAELARTLAAAAREESHTLESLVDHRLRVLASRHVPLRAIRAAPGPHTGRLAFADSTVLLARARRPGELYRLAVAIPDNAITIEAWSHEQDGTVLTFRWPQDSAELVVIGLDQSD